MNQESPMSPSTSANYQDAEQTVCQDAEQPIHQDANQVVCQDEDEWQQDNQEDPWGHSNSPISSRLRPRLAKKIYRDNARKTVINDKVFKVSRKRYAIKKILKDQQYVLVKWQDRTTSWEPLDVIQKDAPEAYEDYLQSLYEDLWN